MDECPATLSAAEARRVIQDLAAADSGRVVLTGHVLKRMGERRITRRQVIRCLQAGTVDEGPFVNERGNWQVNMCRHGGGEETICGVAIGWSEQVLIVRTVFSVR